jgi:hypothetical protein
MKTTPETFRVHYIRYLRFYYCKIGLGLELLCLTPLSTIFQLYGGGVKYGVLSLRNTRPCQNPKIYLLFFCLL